jgi:PAS domain S-box-containing protein
VDAPKRILLVEDEALIALSEKRCLEAAGHVVETVGSGEAAVDVAASTGEDPVFDLILMDINLGRGMDGGEAARRIREAGGPPVVFLSSHAEPGVIAKTCDAGGYGYILKGSGPTVLLTSVRMALDLIDALARLSEREETLQALALASPDIIFSLDRERRISWVNRRREDGPSPVLGMSIYDAVSPASFADVTEAVEGAFSDGRPRQYLAQEHEFSGRPPHWYETSVGPVLRGGQVLSLILVSRDVTARMKAGVMEDGAAGI